MEVSYDVWIWMVNDVICDHHTDLVGNFTRGGSLWFSPEYGAQRDDYSESITGLPTSDEFPPVFTNSNSVLLTLRYGIETRVDPLSTMWCTDSIIRPL
jgi:hypothetical protein